MTIEQFLLGITILAGFTALTTEAVKTTLDGTAIKYAPNLIAAIVAVILAALYCTGYAILLSVNVDIKYIVCSIALCLCSWIGSMTSYDKVIQLIRQIGAHS